MLAVGFVQHRQLLTCHLELNHQCCAPRLCRHPFFWSHKIHATLTASVSGLPTGRRAAVRQIVCSSSSNSTEPKLEVNIQLERLKQRATELHTEAVEQARQAAAGSGQLDVGDAADGNDLLRQRLEAAIVSMQQGLVERDVEVRLLLLAALAGEHILYIGPPGTAKSELGRRLSRLCHGSYFERLLTRFSVPEELFGPLSMRALEEDMYVRQTDGYLPEATVAFVDEIFKANSAILNTLLTILNERLFDNGAKRVHVPLLCLVGASNELPESEELDALYDRFLIRKSVCQVSKAGLLEMLSSGGAGGKQVKALRTPGADTESDDESAPLLTSDDFNYTRQRAVAAVQIPPVVLDLIADLRSYLQEKCEPPVYVSDRRLVKAVALMQVAAYTNGRSRLSEHDCMLLRHVLWQRPEESDRIYDWLLDRLAEEDSLEQPAYLFSSMFARACKQLHSPNTDELAALTAEVAALREALVDQLVGVYAGMEDGFPAVAGSLWFGQEEGQALASALLPKLERAKGEVERLLYEVVTLEAALEGAQSEVNNSWVLNLASLLPDQWAKFLKAPQAAITQGADPVILAESMPAKWAEFMRNAPMDSVRPLGTRAADRLRRATFAQQGGQLDIPDPGTASQA